MLWHYLRTFPWFRVGAVVNSLCGRKPVFGLVFLFQYSPLHDETEVDDDDGSVWFANQVSTSFALCFAIRL